MSKLGKFLGKPSIVMIEDVEFTIYPLKVKDLQLFVGKENSTPEKQMEMSKIIIKKSLRDDEVTDEEIDEMDAEVFMNLMDKINEINGFKDERLDKLAKIKERLVEKGK